MKYSCVVFVLLFTFSLTGMTADNKTNFAAIDVAVKVADHFLSSRTPRLYYADLLTFYSLLKLAEQSSRKD